jgi:hypothetical protein
MDDPGAAERKWRHLAEAHRELLLDPRTAVMRDLAHAVGVPEKDALLWLLVPSSYFEQQDEPMNHLDEPELLLNAAHDEFDAGS